MYRNLYNSQAALTTVRETREERVQQLSETYQAEANAPIPNAEYLTPEGHQDHLDKQRAAAHDRATTAINRIESDLDDALTTIRDNATAVLAPPADPTAALLAEQRQTRAWNRALSLLNSGRSVHQVINTANDADTIAALRAELPTWITAQTPANRSGILGDNTDHQDFAPLMRTLDKRLAEVLPDGTRGFLNVRLAADAIEPAARTLIRGFRNQLSGHGNKLGTALEAHYADQWAARTIPDPNAKPEPTTSGHTPRTLHEATSAHYNTGNDAA